MAKRRANGQGSIYQRQDGRWAASAAVNGERRSFYGKTHAEVAAKLLMALQARRDGLPLPRETQTVKDFLEQWLKTAKPTLRPRTFAGYAEVVKLHLVPELGNTRLARLTPQQVQALLNKKLADKLSPRSVQLIRAILRRALAQALKWGLVARNVATLVDPPRVIRHEITPLSPANARKLMAAAPEDRLGALYSLCLAMGLRQGEALALRWSDLDLDNGLLRVNSALQRIDGAFRLVEPKTAKSRRTLHLPKAVVATLKAQRIRQTGERLRAGPHWQNTWDLVFTTAIGTPLDAGTVTHSFQKFLVRAGIPRIRFHDLRHSTASLLYAQGVPLRSIMEVLGHSQISLTANLYTHIMPALQKDAADRMDAILGG